MNHPQLWHLGAQNDLVHIIDRKPSPPTDYPFHGNPKGPNLIVSRPVPVGIEADAFAAAVVEAHNTEVLGLHDQIAELNREVDRLMKAPAETNSGHAGCSYCLADSTPVRLGEVCPRCKDRRQTEGEYACQLIMGELKHIAGKFWTSGSLAVEGVEAARRVIRELNARPLSPTPEILVLSNGHMKTVTVDGQAILAVAGMVAYLADEVAANLRKAFPALPTEAPQAEMASA